ncbi:MAG: hypothetical protein ACYS8I_00670 [Planctomycetota bacterium]|jgi:hypothetical protein
MKNTSKISQREIRFSRRLLRNQVYTELLGLFAEKAESEGLTKSRIAALLDRDPSQITRWFAEPSNLELDTISDLLIAIGGEMVVAVSPAAGDEMTVDEFMHSFAEVMATESVITRTAVESDGAVELGSTDGARSDKPIHIQDWMTG